MSVIMHRSNRKPAEFPVGAAEPCRILKGRGCCRAPAKSLYMPFEIVRVNCGLPAQTGRGETRMLSSTPVRIHLSRRERYPHQCPNGVNYLAKLFLAPA
jgi:hypothetical protein